MGYTGLTLDSVPSSVGTEPTLGLKGLQPYGDGAPDSPISVGIESEEEGGQAGGFTFDGAYAGETAALPRPARQRRAARPGGRAAPAHVTREVGALPCSPLRPPPPPPPRPRSPRL